MKKICVLLMLVLFAVTLTCVALPMAEAAIFDTVAVKVTVTPVLSVSITEDQYQFGSVAAGSTTVSTAGVSVINNGSGIDETYSLALADPADMTASQTATSLNKYVLNAAFSNLVSGITWNLPNHALATVGAVCTPTKFAGDQTGVAVPYNASRKLWLQFMAPPATKATAEQIIPVTVTAQVS